MKLMFKTLIFCVLSFILTTWITQVQTPALPGKMPDTNHIKMQASLASVAVTPPCLQVHYSIEKYATEYNIPLDYAYGIAYSESGYNGPFDWNYNPLVESSAGAVGPMQIMPQFAQSFVPERKITRKELKNNIDLNVMVSMRMLKKLKEMHGDWLLVFGAYNTGQPVINSYAHKIFNYKPKFKLNEKTI